MVARESLYSLCPFCLFEVTGRSVLVADKRDVGKMELASPACVGNNQGERPC